MNQNFNFEFWSQLETKNRISEIIFEKGIKLQFLRTYYIHLEYFRIDGK